MKNKVRSHSMRKKLALILALALFLNGMINALRPIPAYADDLKEAVYSWGQSLTAEGKEETARLLGVKKGSREIEVKISELNALLHDSYPYTMCYSSSYLVPRKDGGIRVTIATPNNITSITESQYANAAITAGATNMDIYVASIRPIDGSGALAGIYKAFQEEGQALPEENRQAAQKELSVTSKITEANKDKEDFSDSKFNAALAEIKAAIAQKKEENGDRIDDAAISKIIEDTLSNYELDDILTAEQKQSLQDLMKDFSKIRLTEEQKEALRQFGEKLIREGGKLFKDIRSSWDQLSPETKTENENFLRNLWKALIGFLERLAN